MTYTGDDQTHSRWLNWCLYGDPTETLCSRIWRHRWIMFPLRWWIDREAQRILDEPPGHCRRAYEAHRALLAEARYRGMTPDDVLRAIGE